MIKDKQSVIEENLQKLQQAYALVFDPKNPFVQLVLDDLKNFCRMKDSCFHADPRIHAVLEGRREVGLRIDNFCSLSFEVMKQKIIVRESDMRSHK